MRKIRRKIRRLFEFFRYGIKFFIQRGRRGYDDTSHWSADYYLANVTDGILTNLLDDVVGTPCVYPYEVEVPSESNNWCGVYDHDLYVQHVTRVRDFFKNYDSDSGIGIDTEEQLWVFDWLGKFYSSLWS